MKGLSRFETREIHADLDRRELSIELYVPRIEIRGNYDVFGKVLVIDIAGNGPFEATLSDVVGKGYGRLVAVGPPDDQHLDARIDNIDFDIRKAVVRLDNLFNGTLDALAKTVNDFINTNSNMIIDEVKPQIRDEVKLQFESVIRNAFSKLPVKEFFNQLPAQTPRSNRSLRPLNHRRISFF